MKLATLLAVAVLSAGAARAQASLGLPTVGRIVDASGGMRDVHGIAGAFLVDQTRVARVLSLACAGEICLAKTESQVISDTAAAGAPPGVAYFAIDPTGAWAYFPSTRQLARWQDGSLSPLDWNADGDVLALGVDSAGGLLAAVRRAEAVWIVDSHGDALSFLCAASGPVLLLDGGDALYAEDDHLFLKRTDGSEIRFALKDVLAVFAMGEHWAGVRTGTTTYAVRTERGRERLYQLPEAAP